ncbi:sarcosine oxidase subunit alpha family protein (plasmid) [Parasedimentitalea marina]|uniref:Sarcosine oxidase subunit alpha family protein n=1 Tax=Parasedimentitalea marina TaxID=2483033 RepID=A0A3T0NA45_9RHOB|nr:sarcosine oxidase subunit alpha family protein [Parasedimentitalea marina]AZV80924.1 sarcosine oxidase subunit alpha family protein [Parasedimentitalea marina]
MTGRRLSTGGRIDRSQSLDARFDGRRLKAHPGDTLASALVASGEQIVARGFKYHRARGVYSAGAEEPNAYVHLRTGGRHEPNARATTTEAFGGLIATSQNAWPDVRLDAGAVTGYLSPFLSAGFYYKTFIGPFNGTKYWMFCEGLIRKAAGMGRGVKRVDPDSYEKINAFCDLLVIGAGSAGLSAALTAGAAGADVILVEQDFELGGSLLSQPAGGASDDWLAAVKSKLKALPNVRILTRTTAFGAYDEDVYGLVERVSDHLVVPQDNQPRQRYWLTRAKQTVLATGAIERPLVFGNNDLPGVMLAASIQAYANRFGVLPGQRIVLCTNNNSAYQVAVQLAAVGANVTLVDSRNSISENLAETLSNSGVTVLLGRSVIAAKGRRKVVAAMIVPVDTSGKATGTAQRVGCDVIGLSGGWSPVVHLWSQRFGKPRFDEASASFVPDDTSQNTVHCAGRMVALQTLSERVTSGGRAADMALKALSMKLGDNPVPKVPEIALDTGWADGLQAIWAVTDAKGNTKGKAFVDIQHDVKLTDIDQAYSEGYVSVEHLKRYTTAGMAPDQGKTSNIIALARVAELSGRTIPNTGTTTFRPPYTPVAIGALVGHEHGHHFTATRYSPLQDWHVANGAVMSEAGAWMRPWYYPQGDETLRDAYIREATHVRAHVGMIDVSTLGKIAVQGPDAAEFLNRIYVNGWKTLQVGRLRYGVMLREDGFVMDDGATARLGELDYFMSTTTANAAKVLAMSEHLLQTAWKDLKVHVTSVTDQWAAFAIAGPQARNVLQSVLKQADISRAAMPNNHFVCDVIAGVDVRIHRMSYSGELAYEVYVPSGHALRVWDALQDAGKPFDLQPYGTEAMGALRIEKGHVAGPEIEGRTTLKDLGLEGFASSKKPFVGSVLKNRPVLIDPARTTLVGLKIVGDAGAQAGSLIYPNGQPAKGHGDGWVSSTTYSPALGKSIALALVKNGKSRIGEEVQVVNHVSNQSLVAQIVSPHFFDPKGERQNA